MKRAFRVLILMLGLVGTYVAAAVPSVPAPDGGPLPLCPRRALVNEHLRADGQRIRQPYFVDSSASGNTLLTDLGSLQVVRVDCAVHRAYRFFSRTSSSRRFKLSRSNTGG